MAVTCRSDGAVGEDEDQVIKYMKNRPVYECELEQALVQSPFESYQLFRCVALLCFALLARTTTAVPGANFRLTSVVLAVTRR